MGREMRWGGMLWGEMRWGGMLWGEMRWGGCCGDVVG